jgi:cytochrome c-type biogenesis protein CcmH/NrfG
MGMITFFKTPKPKRFEYTPQYYDARKEALQEREKQIKQEMGLADDDAQRVSLIRGQMRRQYEQKMKGRINKGSSLRLVVIFIILCLLAYYMFYY